MSQVIARIFKNHSVFTLLGLILASFQGSIWPQFTGLSIAPQLWLVFVSYFVLHRGLEKAVILNFFYGFLFSYFTVHPLAFFWLSLLLMTITMSFLKDRLLGPGGSSGLTYATVSMLGFLFIWHVSSFTLSYLFEPTVTDPMLLHRLLEILLTIPFAFLIHPLMSYLDSTSDRPSVLATVVTGKGDE